MTSVQLQIPPKLIPVFTGEARYRGAFGGRGSGKTRTFAKMAAVKCYMAAAAGRRGVWVCAREFMNSLADSSFAEIEGAIMSEPWLAAQFDIGRNYIRTKCGSVEFLFMGLRRNITSLKSTANILGCWVDEAEEVPEDSWVTLIPTVREHDSEIWVTWNPKRKNSATHQRFRENPPDNAKIIRINYNDNPWFPGVLEMERQSDLERRAEIYSYIWDGDFLVTHSGAYFAKGLQEAKDQGRIGVVGADKLMTLRAYWDIGGTGAKADACAIWLAQFVGKEVRVLGYYEARGQELAVHVQWLRDNGMDNAEMVLPHDGASNDKVFAVSYDSSLRAAGFKTRVIKNMGAGAANKRIEAVRRAMPQVWFNEETTEAGRDALGAYHPKRDETRGIDLGPEHDWASHGADAFGLMAVDYLELQESRTVAPKLNFQSQFGGGSGYSDIMLG